MKLWAGRFRQIITVAVHGDIVARVRCDQRLHNVLGRPSLGQQLQAVDAVIWVDQCLGRDRAKPGSDMRNAGADREEACRNGNSELPG